MKQLVACRHLGNMSECLCVKEKEPEKPKKGYASAREQ